MASNKTGIDNLNASAGKNLGGTLLKIIAYPRRVGASQRGGRTARRARQAGKRL